MDPQIVQEAIGTVWNTLDNEPDKCMGQTKLASPEEINWAANFKEKLGPFQEFLLAHTDLFVIDTSRGVGKNIVHLVVPQGNAAPAAPIPAPRPPPAVGFNRVNNSVWRPFDLRDGFDGGKLTRLAHHKESTWSKYFHPRFTDSPLYIRPESLSETSLNIARSIFSEAYNKCARLTISIGYVLSHQDITQSLVQGLLQQFLRPNSTSRAIVLLRDTNGSPFLDATVTVWGSGEASAFQDLDWLIQAFTQHRVFLFGKTLSAYQVGYGPAPTALAEGIKELLQMRRNAAQDNAAVQPPSPLPLPGLAVPQQVRPGGVVGGVQLQHGQKHAPPHQQAAAQQPQRAPEPPAPPVRPIPQATRLWPIEYTLEDARKRIHDPNEFTALGDYIRIAAAELQAKERLLREQCAEQRTLPEDKRKKYDSANNVEWIAEKEFFLGRGSDAAVYLGLYQDPGRPSGAASILVAVKQGFDGKNPLNEKEQEHLLTLQGQSGIVRYYTGFELTYKTTSHFILVQDVGISCLRRLVSGPGAGLQMIPSELPEPGRLPSPQQNRVGVTLTADQKFKITKALCIAVKDLHGEYGLMHRDIRPENVLLMADGKVCLSDFGMARQVQLHGHTVYSAMRRSTMQPYEVQSQYLDDAAAHQKIPVAHSSDVFMLGCLITYVNQGREPFTQNSQIYPDKAKPDIDERIRVEQPWLYHLLCCMLDHDHRQRPTCEFVLRHPYFSTHSKNLEVIRRMESTVVADYKPLDDTYFRTLEELLKPLEDKLTSDRLRWYQKLPAEVFTICDYDLPTVRFLGEENSPQPRQHPLPNLAQLLRWIRNVLSHWEGKARPIQDMLRRTRASGTAGGVADVNGELPPYFETAGEFFMKNATVDWLLPMFWKTKSMRVAQVTKERSKLIHANELRQQEFERAKGALEEVRSTIDNLLE